MVLILDAFAVRRWRQYGGRIATGVVGQGQLHKEDLCQGVRADDVVAVEISCIGIAVHRCCPRANDG